MIAVHAVPWNSNANIALVFFGALIVIVSIMALVTTWREKRGPR
jgi:hypothetical protein